MLRMQLIKQVDQTLGSLIALAELILVQELSDLYIGLEPTTNVQTPYALGIQLEGGHKRLVAIVDDQLAGGALDLERILDTLSQ